MNLESNSYLVVEELALTSSVVEVETVLDVFDLILSKVNLEIKLSKAKISFRI